MGFLLQHRSKRQNGRSRFRSRTVLYVTVALLASTIPLLTEATPASADPPPSGLSLVSQIGDFIGQGLAYSDPTVTYRSGDSNFSEGVETFSAIAGADNWDIALSAPTNTPLVVGTYTAATRFST